MKTTIKVLVLVTGLFCLLVIYTSFRPNYYQVVGKNNEHELILRDKWYTEYVVNPENAYVYCDGFRFIGWSLQDIENAQIYF